MNDIVMSGLQLKKLKEKKVEPIIREYDLRPVELDILVGLYTEKNIDTAKGIIQRNHLSKAHISKSLDNLCSKGFICMSEDEDDHRVSHIHLTEKSDAVIEKVTASYAECMTIMCRNIRADEMELVKSVIGRIIENINEELGE